MSRETGRRRPERGARTLDLRKPVGLVVVLGGAGDRVQEDEEQHQPVEADGLDSHATAPAACAVPATQRATETEGGERLETITKESCINTLLLKESCINIISIISILYTFISHYLQQNIYYKQDSSNHWALNSGCSKGLRIQNIPPAVY